MTSRFRRTAAMSVRARTGAGGAPAAARNRADGRIAQLQVLKCLADVGCVNEQVQ